MTAKKSGPRMGALMSVALTEAAVVARAKTVTRRMGWLTLQAGDRLQLCRKVREVAELEMMDHRC